LPPNRNAKTLLRNVETGNDTKTTSILSTSFLVDATRAKTNTTWTHDRSQRRTRVIEGVSFGRRETITFVGALRVTAPLTVDGLTVDGPTVDGPINGCIFLA
jgi:hypothetical protein